MENNKPTEEIIYTQEELDKLTDRELQEVIFQKHEDMLQSNISQEGYLKKIASGINFIVWIIIVIIVLNLIGAIVFLNALSK